MDTLFRNVFCMSFILVLAAIVLHMFVYPFWGPCRLRVREIARKKIFLFSLLLLEQKLGPIGRLKKLALLVAMFCFVVLFLTGFGPRILCGVPLSGWLLMIHATCAPVFIVCVAFLAATWAFQCRFTSCDWDWLVRLVSLKWKGLLDGSALGWKITAWALMILVLPVSLTMIAGMYPIFGTHGQEVLFELHRFTAIALTLAAMIHVYLIIRGRFKAEQG